MRTRRIINGIFWSLLAVAIIAWVCVEWYAQGCGACSLALAVVIYALFCGGLWYCIDEAIRGRD